MVDFVIITKSKNIVIMRTASGDFEIRKTGVRFDKIDKSTKIKAIYRVPQDFADKYSDKTDKEFIRLLKKEKLVYKRSVIGK